jgi:hypothetical protein
MTATRLEERAGPVMRLVGGSVMIALAATLILAPEAMTSVGRLARSVRYCHHGGRGRAGDGALDSTSRPKSTAQESVTNSIRHN